MMAPLFRMAILIAIMQVMPASIEHQISSTQISSAQLNSAQFSSIQLSWTHLLICFCCCRVQIKELITAGKQ